MTPATYATWVGPLRLAGVEGENGSQRATLRCPTVYVQDWCRHRLDARIRPVLAGVLGVGPDGLEIEYVVEAGDGSRSGDRPERPRT
jgi:hypothetical protein